MFTVKILSPVCSGVDEPMYKYKDHLSPVCSGVDEPIYFAIFSHTSTDNGDKDYSWYSYYSYNNETAWDD